MIDELRIFATVLSCLYCLGFFTPILIELLKKNPDTIKKPTRMDIVLLYLSISIIITNIIS